MKKHFKILLSIFGVASLLGGLTSCGGNSNDGSLEITFWHTFGQGIVDELKRQIAKFEDLVYENEGVKVRITPSYSGGYDDLESKVVQAFATGDAPNIAVAYPDHVANYLSRGDATRQFVVNLEDYMNSEEYGLGTEAYLSDTRGEDDIVPAFLAEGTQYAQEGTYSFPLMKSTEIMFYNDLYMSRAIGFYNTAKGTSITNYHDFLSTMNWDTFMDLCEVINDNKVSFTGSASDTNFYPAVYDSDSNMFISQLIQSGNKFISLDANGQGVLDFDGQAAKTMVADLKSDYDKGLFTTKGATGEYGSNLFTVGRSVFSIGSSGGASYNEPTGAAFNMGLCKVPPRCATADVGDATYVSQGPTLTILNKLSESKETQEMKALYAWKFIKYLTATDNNINLTLNSGGYIPVRESCYEDVGYKEYLAETDNLLSRAGSLVIESINGHYFNTPVFKGSSKARDEAGGIITQVLLGRKSVDEAFSDAVNATRTQM